MITRAIDVRGVFKSYTKGILRTPVLHGIDLRVPKGECCFIVGPSGSGKSTLLSILGCLLTPDSGEVHILGEDVSKHDRKSQAEFRLRRIGFVFQRLHLFANLRAWENVAVGLELLGWSRAQAHAHAYELLEPVGLAGKAESRIGELSLGQRQRVALARALAGFPELILADEPTASLDFESGNGAVRILHRLAKERGSTVVIVTHDSRIFRYADRLITLEDGMIARDERATRATRRRSLPASPIRPSRRGRSRPLKRTGA